MSVWPSFALLGAIVFGGVARSLYESRRALSAEIDSTSYLLAVLRNSASAEERDNAFSVRHRGLELMLEPLEDTFAVSCACDARLAGVSFRRRAEDERFEGEVSTGEEAFDSNFALVSRSGARPADEMLRLVRTDGWWRELEVTKEGRVRAIFSIRRDAPPRELSVVHLVDAVDLVAALALAAPSEPPESAARMPGEGYRGPPRAATSDGCTEALLLEEIPLERCEVGGWLARVSRRLRSPWPLVRMVGVTVGLLGPAFGFGWMFGHLGLGTAFEGTLVERRFDEDGSATFVLRSLGAPGLGDRGSPGRPESFGGLEVEVHPSCFNACVEGSVVSKGAWASEVTCGAARCEGPDVGQLFCVAAVLALVGFFVRGKG